MSTSCGSPCYAAPELVMNQGVYVGPAVDIWSCGVILFAMLCGYLPYDDDPANPESYNINLLYKYILNTPLIFPDYISEEACDLLSLMLVPDPEKRCTMETIMAHPWLSPHQHLFVQIPQEEDAIPEEGQSEEEQVVPDQDTPMPEPARRNTTIGVSQYQNDANEIVDIPQTINEQQTSSEDQEMEELPSEQQEETTAHATTKDTPMQDISSIELPPLTADTVANETDETTAEETATKQQAEQQPPQQESETPASPSSSPPIPPQKQDIPIIHDEVPPISPLPTFHQKTQNRPKSTISSTEKVLHFLSGHSNTPKPGNTNEKRTRHMSLAIENGAPSILQAKFLSSINQRKTASPSPPPQQQPTPEASPSPNTSASTPHPSKKPNNTKRNVRHSTMTPPPQPQPSHTSDRGTRRKTLSLLVNSMADNTKMPFSNRRQSNTRTPPPPSTAATEERVHMMPSVSEHTINRMTDKEKHRSAGKKLMDWFKKKPLSKSPISL